METMVEEENALDWVLSKVAAAKKQPVDFLSNQIQPRKDLAQKKSSEMDMWKTWKEGGQKPEHLDPLLKSFAPLIQSRVNQYKNKVEIPTSAIEHEHKKEFVNALRTYDPTKGASLSTHIVNRLPKAGRYIDSNKNIARIPENIYTKIGYFNSLKSNLSEQLGHEPDDATIHDHLLKTPHEKLGVLSMKDIGRLNKEQRKVLILSASSAADIIGTPNLSSREEEVVHLVYHELSPQERLVHEHTFGMNGKPILKPGDMAKKLKMDGPKISKLKASIRTKILKYLEE